MAVKRKVNLTLFLDYVYNKCIYIHDVRYLNSDFTLVLFVEVFYPNPKYSKTL